MADEPIEEIIPEDLLEDYADAGIAEIIEQARPYLPLFDHVSTAFPFVRTAITAIKLPRNLSDLILGRKVNAFLFASGLDEQKMQKLREKLSEAKQKRLWEQVVLALNAHDDTRRSEIIGKLFAALINDYLGEEEFFALVHVTNSVNLALLDDLLQIYKLSDDGPYLKTGVYYALVTSGLVELHNGISGTWDGGTGPSYPLNQIGWKYAGIVFNHPDSNVQNVKVGVGELIGLIGENGLPTGKAFPLETMQHERRRYGEVDIFLLSPGGLILCEEDSCKPVVIQNSPIPAGLEALGQAWKLIDGEDFTHLTPVRIYKSDDPPVQRNAFTVIGEFQPSHTMWKEFHQMRQELMNNGNPDEHVRYLLAVTEQIERHMTDPGLPSLGVSR